MNKIEYIDKYNINYNNLLGSGSFSNVYKCQDLSNNTFAIKIINKTNKIKVKNMIMNEISILKMLNSPYIINLIDFIDKDNKMYLILELAQFNFIDVIQKIKFNEIFIYLKQLLKCLIYIQSFNIVHNDIKPANILIQIIDDKNFRLKLCDFGMSTDMDNNHNFFCGSPMYMNLDRLKGNYKSNSDFWAIKIIYYYMIYGKHPYEGATNIKELIKLINNGIKFSYEVIEHTNILKELFNNIIDTPHILLQKIELIENNLLNHDNNVIEKYNNIERQPYKDYSIYVNISSVHDSDYYFKEDDFYQKIIDEEFSGFLLLE